MKKMKKTLTKFKKSICCELMHGGRNETNGDDVYFAFSNVFNFTFRHNASKILKKR